MPILLCFQKKSKVAMYRRLSEARNPACIRGTACRPPRFRPPLRLRQVPSALSPLQRGGRCLDQVPIVPRCPLIAGVPASTGPGNSSTVGPAASTGLSVRPGALRQWGLAALWRPCMLLQTPAIEPAPSTQAAGRCAVCPWINVHAAFLCRKDRWQLCMVIRYGWQNSMGSA